MRYRLLRSSLVALSAVIALMWLATSAVHAQPQTAAPDAATSRTPWGDPDLQGLWNNFTITPLERPAAVADQEFLTAEEAASLEQRAVDGVDRSNAPSAVRTDRCRSVGMSGRTTAFGPNRARRLSRADGHR